nr:RNA polymerase II elongation factor Ell-like [Bactrocera oleae]
MKRMEDSYILLTLSSIQTTQKHDDIENTIYVPKAHLHSTHEKEQRKSLNANKSNFTVEKRMKKKSLKEDSNSRTSTKQHDNLIDCKETISKSGDATNVDNKKRKASNIASREIRERLIHLLALKPFKKLELYARLQKEGIRKAEKLLISNILTNIAQLSNNAYNLKHCMWNRVNENWPYYTEQEQQQLTLRKIQNLTNPISSNEVSSTSDQITASTTSARPPIQEEADFKPGFKRSCLDYEEPQISKKRRISHGSTENCQKTYKSSSTNTNSKNHLKSALQTSFAISGNDTYNNQNQEPYVQTTSNESTAEHLVIEEIDTATPSYDFSNYLNIQSIEQRRQYKNDFERDYEEYFPLRQRVEEVRHIFRVLHEQLQNVPEGSLECERVKHELIAEYQRLNSKEEIELKRRFDYLEAKLIHIRQLVDNFDERLLEEKAVQAAVAAANDYILQQKQRADIEYF